MFYDDPSNFVELLPERLQGIVELNAIGDAVNIHVDKLAAYIKKWTDNKSPSNADEDGCARWEKILALSTPLNGSLQSRRDAIRAKLMSKPPINENALQAVVEAYMGVPVGITVSGYQITIKYRGESRQPDLSPLYNTMWKMIPADMLVDIAYLYLTFGELTAQNLTFGQLTAKNLTMEQLGKGEWIT